MRRFVPALALLVLSLATPALAQFETATVVGTVRDSSGAVVADAKVTLTNTQTGVSAERQSDANGSFEFFTVRIGTYLLSAEKAGFSIAVVDNVQVTVGARQRVELTMAVGQVTETVEVSANAVLLQTDSSERSQVITGEQTRALPLNGREYSQLALLSPGVRVSPLAQGGREGSFNVNGLRSTFNNFLIDGVDNNAYGTSNQGFSNQVMQPSPDSVDEFKVVTNNMSAEYGRAAGATINVAYASGTNQYRGSVWEFARRTALNATGFFRPPDGVKPPFERDQYGGVIGGPIVRNKAFFFADFEGFQQTRGQTASTTIANQAQRNGILGVDVRNPLTGQLYPAGTPIPMTAFARKVLSELPEPTNDRASNNYQRLQNFENTTNKAGGKINFQVNPRLSAFGRFGWRDVDIFDNPNIPLPSGGAGNAFTYARNKQLALGTTYMPTGLSLLEIRFGWSNDRRREGPGRDRDGQRARRLRHRRPADRSARRRRPADAADQRVQRPRPAGDQPAMAVPHGLQPEGELHLAGRPALAEERLRVPAHPDRSAGRQPALRPRFLRRIVLAAGRRDHHEPALQPRRLHVRRAQRPTRSATSWWPTSARTCTSPICRTTSGSTTT